MLPKTRDGQQSRHSRMGPYHPAANRLPPPPPPPPPPIARRFSCAPTVGTRVHESPSPVSNRPPLPTIQNRPGASLHTPKRSCDVGEATCRHPEASRRRITPLPPTATILPASSPATANSTMFTGDVTRSHAPLVQHSRMTPFCPTATMASAERPQI